MREGKNQTLLKKNGRNHYILSIILNVNGLNYPIKRHILEVGLENKTQGRHGGSLLWFWLLRGGKQQDQESRPVRDKS
jgi:hypothetical protein